MNDNDDKTRLTRSTLVDTAGGDSDKGPVRKANEDAFRLPDENAPTHLGRIYIVADGVGGQEYGAVASQMAVRIVHDTFYESRQEGLAVPAALQRAAEQANLAIYDEAQARGVSRMGCTLVTAVHHQDERTLIHAGDARAYLLRGGELQQLTRDDTWVQRQVEEGIIGEETAAHHELRHVVTRVLGNKPTLEVTLSASTRIEAGDCVLLCSDGLYDVVPPEQIQQILTGYSPQAAAETLVRTAIKEPAKDNITAVVIHSKPKTAQQPTVAMSTAAAVPPTGTAVPERRERNGVRLPLWALGLIVLALLLGIGFGLTALWRQVRPSPTPTPTVVPAGAPVNTPVLVDTAVPPPTAAPTPLPTQLPPVTATPPAAVETAVTPEPTAEPPANLACITSPGAFTFVWQDTQITGSGCNQFAAEGFVLSDGDQVIILDPDTIGVLGPDATCLENEFIKVQSVADAAITGWVLFRNVQTTTPEQGCPP